MRAFRVSNGEETATGFLRRRRTGGNLRGDCRVSVGGASVLVDFEIDVNLGTIVELADRAGVAFVAFELGVHLIVHVGESRKAIGAVLPDDVGFYRMGPGVGEINDGTNDGIVMLIEHLAGQQTALGAILFIERGTGHREYEKDHASQQRRLSERQPGNHAFRFVPFASDSC